MSQRLIWNFEISLDKPFPVKSLKEEESGSLKWEARFFWNHPEIISLCALDESMLDLSLYKHKHREDVYYLLPDYPFNIKKRRQELLYKPMLKQSSIATAFGPKLNLEEASKEADFLKTIQSQISKAQEVFVTKEAFIYKFKTKPAIKLELARLEVENQIYFSACIEGRSQNLVEKISKHLLQDKVSCDYVSFLKKIIQHDKNPI